MPTIIVVRGFRLFFYSNEGRPPEPVHVHIRKAGGEAKVWIEPAISLARSVGFASADEGDILEIVRDNVDRVRRRWREFFDP